MAFQVMFKDEKWFPDLWEEITWEVIKITEKTKKKHGKTHVGEAFPLFYHEEAGWELPKRVREHIAHLRHHQSSSTFVVHAGEKAHRMSGRTPSLCRIVSQKLKEQLESKSLLHDK